MGICPTSRVTCCLALLLLFPSSLEVCAAETLEHAFRDVLKPFLQRHCVACHGDDEPASNVRLDAKIRFEETDRHLWTLVHEQLASGAMPPKGEARPAIAEQTKVLDLLAAQQRALGRGGTRRLNRREFTAALQDATGLTVEFSNALPDDGKVNGFDTGIEGLQDSADSVAQALLVARRAVNGIRFVEPSSGKVYAADIRESKDVKKVFDQWKADGVGGETGDLISRAGTGWLIKPKWLGDRGGMGIRIASPNRDGILRLKLEVSVQKFVEGVPNPHLWIEVGGRDIAYVALSNTPDKPRVLEYQVHLGDVAIDPKRGLVIQLANRVEVPYAIDGFPNEDRSKPDEKIPGGTGLWRPQFDAKTTPLERQPVPFIVLHSFEVETDFEGTWPPASWHVETSNTADRATAERLIRLCLERAWRRPVGRDEPARFLALFDKCHEQGLGFDDALRSAFQSVFLTGSMRNLESPRQSPSPQYALASRLSFMLWGRPPDDELRRLAAAGKLTDRAVLAEQVERLLADPRSDGFFEPFVMQWLEMGQPITVAMEHIQKQDFRFGRNLKASMRNETIAYIRELFVRNRPARELISSDWTMLNDILAQHYGYEGVAGGELRKVMLRKDDPRGGGVLGHAGIQSMLCWMGDNWVIYRGAWTLRRVLDAPPPPPPLEVPELLPSDGKNQGKSFKELLKQHQEDTKCAVCHKHMDPLGFAFQNFDLSGRWRDREFEKYVKNDLDGKIEWRGSGKDRPVDAAGRLPRGETFETFAECKHLLCEHYADDVVRGLLKHLILYGGGRQAEIDDLIEVRRIMSESKTRDYLLRDLLQTLIRSPSISETSIR